MHRQGRGRPLQEATTALSRTAGLSVCHITFYVLRGEAWGLTNYFRRIETFPSPKKKIDDIEVKAVFKVTTLRYLIRLSRKITEVISIRGIR